MSSTNKSSWDVKFLLKVTLSMFFLVLIFAVMIVLSLGFTDNNESFEWDDGWTIQVRDETYVDQSISQFGMDTVDPGETVILTNNIPDTFGDRAISVSFFSYQSKVEAYIDGNSYYSYGRTEYNEGSFIPTENNVLDLGSENCGKEIRIEITASNHYSFKYVDKIIIGPNNQLFSYLMHSKFVAIFSGLFLVSVGLITIGLSLIFLIEHTDWVQTFVMGVFIILLGAWIESNSRALFVFNNDSSLDTIIEYVTFYLFPLPLTLYFRNYAQKNKRNKNIWLGFLSLQIIGFILSIILHVSNVVYFPDLSPYWHVFYVTYAVFLVFLMIRKFVDKSADKYDKLLFAGFFVFAVSVILGILASEFSPSNFGVPLTSTIVLPAASVILVLFLLGSYFSRIIDYLYQKGEHDSLTRLAYVDFLTDIPNRTNAVKYMERIDNKNDQLAVMSCDVNDLKRVNDKFGHLVGDELLKDFAEILRETFAREGSVIARMGGDEFLVVFNGTSKEKIETQIETFKDNIKNFNETGDRIYKLSICYGIAFRKKGEDINALDLYKESDDRMYAMKQEYHKSHPRYNSNDDNS